MRPFNSEAYFSLSYSPAKAWTNAFLPLFNGLNDVNSFDIEFAIFADGVWFGSSSLFAMRVVVVVVVVVVPPLLWEGVKAVVDDEDDTRMINPRNRLTWGNFIFRYYLFV